MSGNQGELAYTAYARAVGNGELANWSKLSKRSQDRWAQIAEEADRVFAVNLDVAEVLDTEAGHGGLSALGITGAEGSVTSADLYGSAADRVKAILDVDKD